METQGFESCDGQNVAFNRYKEMDAQRESACIMTFGPTTGVGCIKSI